MRGRPSGRPAAWTRGTGSGEGVEARHARARASGAAAWPEGWRTPDAWLDELRGVESFRFPGTEKSARSACQASPDIVHAHNLHGGYFDLRALPGLSRRVPVVLYPARRVAPERTLRPVPRLRSLEDRLRGVPRPDDLPAAAAGRHRGQLGPQARHPRAEQALRRHAESVADGSREGVDRRPRPGRCARDPQRGRSRRVPARGQAGRAGEAGHRGRGPGAAVRVPRDPGQPLQGLSERCAGRWRSWPSGSEGADLQLDRLGRVRRAREDGRSRSAASCPSSPNPGVVASYYQAADLYVHATLADTFPSTVIEALACGTPVVASDVGRSPRADRLPRRQRRRARCRKARHPPQRREWS